MMAKNINLKTNPGLNIYFVVEGATEKYIIEKLVKENRFIEEFQPKESYSYQVIHMGSKDKLTYKHLTERRQFSANPKEIKQSIFIVFGDDLDKYIIDFDKEEESKDSLHTIIGPEYENRINYVTIMPESEIILIQKNNLMSEFNKSKGEKPSVFLARKLKLKTPKLKSRDYWEKEFAKKGDLYNAIKKIKQNRNNKNNKVILLKDILK